MNINELKESIDIMSKDEVIYRLSDNESQKHTINIEAQSDINQFGKLQFNLSEIQRELTEIGNILISRLKEIENNNSDTVTFYYKKLPLFEKRMTPTELNKITLNDFIMFDGEKFVVYSKFWNADDDIMYIMLESEKQMKSRYDEMKYIDRPRNLND